MSSHACKRVVVLGAGFGGLNAVDGLGREVRCRVTFVDRNNYHLFLPLLYQVAIAGLEAPQVTYPVRSLLRNKPNARFRLGAAEHVDLVQQKVFVEGQALEYDYLIIALGSRTADFGVEGVREHAFGLKALEEAMTIRDRLLSACEAAVQTDDPRRRQALLTFVIVGGGPTGIETAGALGELRRHVIRRDFPELELSELRVLLIEMAPRVLSHLDAELSDYSADYLRELGVDVRLSTVVQRVAADGVQTADGGFVPTFTVIWSAGVAGVSLPGLPAAGRGGRIETSDDLSLPSAPNVFVVGDMNGLLDGQTGRPLPQVAQLAIQQGRHAAANIICDLNREPRRPFRYRELGNMVTLGRNHAVAERGRLRFRGFAAWVVWLGVHLINLIGFRNRLMVLINWAYSYFTYDYAIRTLHRRARFPAAVDGRTESAAPGKPGEPSGGRV